MAKRQVEGSSDARPPSLVHVDEGEIPEKPLDESLD